MHTERLARECALRLSASTKLFYTPRVTNISRMQHTNPLGATHMQDITQILKCARIRSVFLGEDKISLEVMTPDKIYELVIEYNEEREKDPVQKPLSVTMHEIGDTKEIIEDKIRRFYEALDRACGNMDALVNIDMINQHLLYLEEWGDKFEAILINGLKIEVAKDGEYISIRSLHNPEG